jgi:photosystem II stability/assembly factor-like uncharacterized protein
LALIYRCKQRDGCWYCWNHREDNRRRSPLDHPVERNNPLAFWGFFYRCEYRNCGCENGTILRTTDGGNTWVSQTSGTTNALFSVSFTDVNHGTAVGDYGTILRTTNGGASWVSQTSGTTNALNSVSFTDANRGTAVSWYGIILRTNRWRSQLGVSE